MESNTESPKFTPPQVEYYFTKLPYDLKLKPGYLKPWFDYFEDINLSGVNLETIGKEFAVAHALKQWIMDCNLAKNLKPELKSAEELKYKGIDPARLVRYLILQVTYPSGIELNNEKIVFTLNHDLANKLLEGIKTSIPGYNNLTKEQFERILEDLGFRYSIEAGSHINSVDQDRFKEMLAKIANTQSF